MLALELGKKLSSERSLWFPLFSAMVLEYIYIYIYIYIYVYISVRGNDDKQSRLGSAIIWILSSVEPKILNNLDPALS
jgi:hypothetical protein